MILIISTCKDALSESEFVNPIIALVKQCVVRRFDKVKQEDIDNASEIIIAGTALADFDYLKKKWDWLKTCKTPVLGICAGMQVLALAHGGKLIKEEAIGVQQVTVTELNPFCHGTFNAYFLHTKAVEGLQPLAVVGKKIVMVKVPNKEQYGVIFHPEVMNPDIIKKFSGSVSLDSKL
jgi:GMP synthase-like glutamine amidotransferase